jgi:glycosyltransferase involved in cell wall biosynthesis
MSTEQCQDVEMTSNAPKVSVIIPVYNLEKFIRPCLESILQQKADFEFEVIVADDASTDGSKEVIKKVKGQYPNIVQVIYQPKNLGLIANLNLLLASAKGQYIAYLDGDDIAMPGKLSKQARYLDEHPTCAISYHESEVFDSDSDKTMSLYTQNNYNFEHIPVQAELTHLIKYGTFLQASSVMFRRHEHLDRVIDMHSSIIVDYPMHIANTYFIGGTIDYIDEVLGRYRVHNESFGAQTARSVTRREKVLKDLCEVCDRSANFGVSQDDIEQGKMHFTFAAALYFLRMNEFVLFKKYIEARSADIGFFNDKHRYAFENRAKPAELKSYLFQ